MSYSSIAWLPLCAGLTVLGLVLSYLAGRRRGHLSMLRGAAWSLLPLAAYLTGSVEMFWQIGAAIGHFASGFVFSPVKWAGIGVAGVSAILFFATRGRERRRHARDERRAAAEGTPGKAGSLPGSPAAAVTAATRALDGLAQREPERGDKVPALRKSSPAVSRKGGAAAKTGAAKGGGADDDLADIEEILRKRGL